MREHFPFGRLLFSLAVLLITAGIVILILQAHPAPSRPEAEQGTQTAATPVPTPTPSPTPSPSPPPRVTEIPTATPIPTVYPTVRRGDKGEAVVLIQQKLISLGYLKGRADGDFGAKTEQALKDYQAVQGLTEDGVAGPRTMIHLFDGGSIPQCTVYRNAGERTYHTRSDCGLLRGAPEELKLSDAVRLGLEECVECH